jgi:hypothetical protein
MTEAASTASTARHDPDQGLIMGKDCSVASRLSRRLRLVTAPAALPPSAVRRHDETTTTTFWIVATGHEGTAGHLEVPHTNLGGAPAGGTPAEAGVQA